jgi:hypothetical protein
MWIRTQDKDRLKEVKEVGLDISGFQIYAYEYFDTYCHSTYLGEYPTKQRCLEVLDEIQQAIVESNIKRYEYVNSESNKIEYTYNNISVYKMPEV